MYKVYITVRTLMYRCVNRGLAFLGTSGPITGLASHKFAKTKQNPIRLHQTSDPCLPLIAKKKAHPPVCAPVFSACRAFSYHSELFSNVLVAPVRTCAPPFPGPLLSFPCSHQPDSRRCDTCSLSKFFINTRHSPSLLLSFLPFSLHLFSLLPTHLPKTLIYSLVYRIPPFSKLTTPTHTQL